MPRSEVIYTAAEVAEAFRRAGFAEAVASSEADDMEDGEVQLADGHHVQVGYGYLMLSRWNEADDSMTIVRQAERVDEVVEAYREVMRPQGEPDGA